MRTLIVALMAAFFMSGSAYAQCSEGTAPVETLVKFLNDNNVTESFQVKEPYASSVTSFVNAMDPPTNWKPDRVIVYFDHRAAMIVLHIGECFATLGPMPRHVVKRIIVQSAKGA
jgi:hypothetical protein